VSVTQSFMHRAAALDMLGTRGLTTTTHVLKLALFTNAITPDPDASAANSAYNAGQYLTANEVYQAGQWAQGGVAISGLALSTGTRYVMLDATDPVSGTNATLSGARCGLVYDTQASPVTNQGLSLHNFGADTGITNGTYTAAISANGILRATV